MALVPYESKVEMWGWDRETGPSDRIRVVFEEGAEAQFVGHAVRSDFGGVRLLSDRTFSLDLLATDNGVVIDVLSRFRTILKGYRSRWWRFRHLRNLNRFCAWVGEHVEFVIWPTDCGSTRLDGQLAKGHPLLILPVIDDCRVDRLPNVEGDYIRLEPFDALNPHIRYRRYLVADVATIAAPVAQAV